MNLKPANFLEKSMCFFVVDKSNDSLVRKIKHIISYYQLTLRQHSGKCKLELKYMQIKTTKRWFPALGLAIKARHITMQTNCMILEILFSDSDLNIFKNKKEECYASLQRKRYFTNWYSPKLHSDVFLFEQLHCNSTNYHTTTYIIENIYILTSKIILTKLTKCWIKKTKKKYTWCIIIF